ncbi:MAG: beta-ketoacyl-[acyl-carrier-protein] synthase family protein [Thermodesulfobacteriota bacterium]|nr:beta-ketoacyl-[acyl-carrier-protein] synthase family protein [Thermodesulfobacteriota bacterium]
MVRRAVITGLGIVSPLGEGVLENWQKIADGESGIKNITFFDTNDYPVKVAGEIHKFNHKKYIDDKFCLELIFRNVKFALSAARMAIEDSELETKKVKPEYFGVITGSGGSGFDGAPFSEDISCGLLKAWDNNFQKFKSRKFGENGQNSVHPLFLLKMLPNNAIYYLSSKYNIKGENYNIVNTYTGGADAIGRAFRCIGRGDADIILAGGYDSLIFPNTIFTFYSLNMASLSQNPNRACRPFDLYRDGLVASEGAGFLVIEELEHAKARNAKIYGEIIGYGNAASAYHLFEPCPLGFGLIRAMERAIENAGISREKIDYINADGIGTIKNDRIESIAVKNVFGRHAYKIPMSSLKGSLGHTGCASGAIETIISLYSLKKGIILPTINYENPDPECNLDYVPNYSRKYKCSTFMAINQGIGGQNSALIING